MCLGLLAAVLWKPTLYLYRAVKTGDASHLVAASEHLRALAGLVMPSP